MSEVMDLQALVGPSVSVIRDRRADKRDTFTPEAITVESSYHLGDKGKQIDAFNRSAVVPVVFIDSESNVWCLTAGGSGLVVFESADEKPLDDQQAETVEKVVSALQSHFVLNKAKPKTKKQKPKVEETLVGVSYPEITFEDQPLDQVVESEDQIDGGSL